LFLLTVWADDNGKPGEVLYEDGVFDPRSPISGYGENYFQSYYLMDTMRLPVPTRFYVGWRQFDPERLNAGLDRNTNSAGEIFYSVDGGNSWPTSPFLGSAMIRPIFSTRLNDVLGIEEKLNEHRFYVYPNPASEILHVNIANSEKFEGTILDIFGKLVKHTLSAEIEIRDLAPGTYFLSSPFFKGKVLKFIKQ
ncbi:MAG: T9SS type A sorting domain-containing protein, partial [Bacteroidetes bacterium]|nr:T9SS type A sorting domain-containing protein [Bacteroidota bacterium]